MLGLMILLFVFASLTKSQDKILKFAGYLLVYTVIIITCASAFLLADSVFFNEPKPIEEILGQDTYVRPKITIQVTFFQQCVCIKLEKNQHLSSVLSNCSKLVQMKFLFLYNEF